MKLALVSRFLLNSAILAFLIVPACPQVADTDWKQIESFVQQNKSGEAVAKIDELLETNPNDQKLKETREKLAATSSPKAAVAPLSEDDRLEFDTLLDIAREAQASSTPEEQTKLLSEFLVKSKAFVAAHPEQTRIWLLRAVSALALDRPQDGWEAGQHLISAGMKNTDDPQTRQILAKLNRKGWLITDRKGIEEAQAALDRKSQSDLLAGLWKGTWTRNSPGSNTRLIIQQERPLRVFYEDDFKNPKTGGSIHRKIPGSISITGESEEGTGELQMLNLRFENGHLLLFEAVGSVTAFSDRSKIPMNNWYMFYYDPALKDAIFGFGPLTEDAPRVPAEKIREIMPHYIAKQKPEDFFYREGPAPKELNEYLDARASQRMKEAQTALVRKNKQPGILARLWNGVWRCNELNYNATFTFEQQSPVKLLYTECEQLGSETSICREIPGKISVLADCEEHGTDKGEGKLEMQNLRLEEDGRVLIFDCVGEITTEHNGKIPVRDTYIFYYDPALKDAVIRVGVAPTAEAPNLIPQFVARAKKLNPGELSTLKLFYREEPAPKELNEYLGTGTAGK